MNTLVKFAIIGAAAAAASTYLTPKVVSATGPVAGEYTADVVSLGLAAVTAVLASKVL